MVLRDFFYTAANKLGKRPFIIITLGLAIGIILGNLVETEPLIYLITFLIISIPILFIKRKPLFLLIILIILLGGLRVSLKQTISYSNIKYIVGKLGPEAVNIRAKVIAEPEISANRSKILLEMKRLENKTVSGKLMLFIKDKTDIQFGDIISFSASLRQPRKNNNPYAFNYKEYLESNHIYATAFLFSTEEIDVIESDKNLYYFLVVKPRQWIRGRIQKIYSGREAGFLTAIFLGEKYRLPDRLVNDFANSGLSHILAVSGLHTGVIALILLALLQILFKKRNFARVITIMVLIYYIFLSHYAASVQRAVLMISLFLIGRMSQRNIDNVNILFASAFIILLINPYQLFSIGFQFSFLSVFSILVILPIIANQVKPVKAKSKILFWLLNMMLVSFVVQLILAPFTSLYFHKIAFGGIIANVVAIPLISMILPLALLTIFLPITFINQFYITSEKFLLDILFSISHFVSKSKLLLIDFISTEKWQAYISIFLLALIVMGWCRRTKLKKKLKTIVAGTMAILLIFLLPEIFSDNLLEITVLDVKTGDAIFIKTPTNKNILIDTGNKTRKNNYAQKVIIPFFRKKEVRQLDLMVLTHPHADHIGGAKYILDRIDVDEILLPKCSYNSRIYMNLLNMINKNNLNKTYADTSLVFAEFSQIKLKVLAPYQGYKSDNLNNYSVVLKYEYKDFSCVLTGDAEKEVENWLVKTYDAKLDIDFLKVGHHGSRTASTDEFIRKTSPEYGVISVGKYNRFGLPNMDVIEKLQRNEVTVFRTDKDGAVIFSTDGEVLNIKTILTDKEIVDNSI